MMYYSTIIVAAGNSSRSNLSYNKVFYKINNMPIILLATKKFLEDQRCQNVFIVCKEAELETFKKIFLKNDKITYVFGGNTRQESVYNALKQVKCEYVLIHDGARPYVTKDLIDRVIKKLENSNAVIPVLNVTDTIKVVQDDYVIKTLNRNVLKAVQTPQGFKTSIIKKAHLIANTNTFTDDSSMVEELLNEKVYTIEGSLSNIKFTTNYDFNKEK